MGTSYQRIGVSNLPLFANVPIISNLPFSAPKYLWGIKDLAAGSEGTNPLR
jgi:hypothetical protein